MVASQLQSPLLRIPRELRDMIYEYYAHDDAGLTYDYASRNLRYATKEVHDDKTALTYTCKAIAAELKGVAMQVNDIKFRPARSENDSKGRFGLHLHASRFHRLFQQVRRIKMLVLDHVVEAGCVSPAMIDHVAARYPSIARFYRTNVKLGTKLFRFHPTIIGLDRNLHWQFPVKYCEAIHDTLELASSYPRFDAAVAAAFLSDFDSQGHPLLPDRLAVPDVPEPFAPVAWYFSASSVAIDLLGRLAYAKHMKLKGKLILEEEMRGVAYPESHVRGFLPYYLENPQLRIEMHASFWTNLMPEIWLDPPIEWGFGASTRNVVKFPRILADFIDEVLNLQKTGMNSECVSVILEGQQEVSREAWEKIKDVAADQDTMENCEYMQTHGYPSLSFCNKSRPGQTGYALQQRFLVLYDLPACFSQEIRRIVESNSVIHFDGDAGDYSPERKMNNRYQWSPRKFISNWRSLDGLQHVRLRLPRGGVPPMMKKYELQALRRGGPWIVGDNPRLEEPTKFFEYHPLIPYADVFNPCP